MTVKRGPGVIRSDAMWCDAMRRGDSSDKGSLRLFLPRRINVLPSWSRGLFRRSHSPVLPFSLSLCLAHGGVTDVATSSLTMSGGWRKGNAMEKVVGSRSKGRAVKSVASEN